MTADPPKNILAGKSSHRDIQQRRGTQQPYASRPATAPPPPAPCLARKAAPRCRHCLAAATPLARRGPGLARRRWHPGPGQAAPPRLVRRRRSILPGCSSESTFLPGCSSTPLTRCRRSSSHDVGTTGHCAAAAPTLARRRRHALPGGGCALHPAAARLARQRRSSPGCGSSQAGSGFTGAAGLAASRPRSSRESEST